jgi:hypothetical protein
MASAPVGADRRGTPHTPRRDVELRPVRSRAYTKPWTVLIKERLIADAELIDEICLENERSLKHMK